MNHIRDALRQLTRRPGLSLVVILMLALGIGATTAMFSVFHQILVRPLPVAEPGRLVNLREPGAKEGRASCSFAGPIGYEYCFSYPMFRDLEAEQKVFTGLAAHYTLGVNLTHGEQTQSGLGLLVSGSYFSVLNVEPTLGRLIGPQDEPRVGESAVAVLSHDYWKSNFGGDPDVLGETLTVNGQPLTVIGVGPAGFTGTTLGNRPQVFAPLTLRWRMQPTMPRDAENRQSYWLHLFARLNPGGTVEQASAAINGLHRGILDEVEAPLNTRISDAQFRERRLTLEPGARGETELRAVTRAIETAWGAEQQLTLLLGITLVVLLIVCINLANLLLARGASRRGEIAIRASIGASRRNLVFQLFTEVGVLAAIGAVLSLPVAAITLGIVTTILPERLADGFAIGLHPAGTLFAVAISLLTVLAFGLAPALRTTRANLGLVLKGHASKSAGSRGIVRFRTVLVTTQIAFSMVLLVLAGLFAQSLVNVARVNLGIDVDSLVSFQVAPGLNGDSQDRMMALYDRLDEELATQPGVTSVSSASIPVIANSFGLVPVSLEGSEPAPGENTSTSFNMVGTGFFDTLSIPLLAGRDFTAADTLSSARVAIVNQSFVRRFNLGDRALGRRFNTPLTSETEIVGVVADAKSLSVKDEPRPQFFVPRRQVDNVSGLSFYLRGGIEPDALARMISRVVASVDPNLPVRNLITMEQQIRDNVYLDRLIAILSTGFAGLATLLASIGLYGILAYNVTLRTRELGLRLALGATPRRLCAMVLKHVGTMAFVGGAIGLAAAVASGRFAEALLYGLSGYDLRVLSAAVAVLAVVVLAAAYIPARRASAIAPMEALRYE